MKTELVSPGTQKIVSYAYRSSTLLENMSEGMQKLAEGVFWLVLNDGKNTLVPIKKTFHQNKSCFVCDIMRGTFTSAQALAKAYDEVQGNQHMTFKTVNLE